MSAAADSPIDKVLCTTTPGNTVDVLVTQRGIAVNPLRKDLEDKLRAFGLPVYDIHELKDMAERVTGKPQTRVPGGRAAAEIEYRDGRIIDRIRCVV
jgi:citrate lyase subunit alpha/citrate CoA-transferase